VNSEKSVTIRIILTLVLSLALLLFSCFDEDDDDDPCEYKPSDCVETPYTEGELRVTVTEKPGVTLTVNIYNGIIDPESPPVPLTTLYITGTSTSLTLPLGDYSGMVDYNVNGNLVSAVDGDSIVNISESYCDGTCYNLANANLNLEIDEDAFSDYLAGERENCFIATAAYGSFYSFEVEVLRKFRERFLMSNRPGRFLVRLYYRYSPPIAEFIREREYIKPVVRGILLPVVFFTLYPSVSVLILAVMIFLIIVYKRRWRHAR
jgi:hypothetical protein